MKKAATILLIVTAILFTLSGCGKINAANNSGANPNGNISNNGQNQNNNNVKITGKAGNAVNAAEDIQSILNGLKDDNAEIDVDTTNSKPVDKPANELNSILNNDSDNVDFNN